MLILDSTSDVVRVVTGSAVTTDVYATWADQTTTAFTPGDTPTAITTATTTTVVAAPGASTQRLVKLLSVRNTHASSSNLVTIQRYDGSTAYELWKGTLLAGEAVLFTGTEWIRLNATGYRVQGVSGGPVDVQVFTSGSGSWTKPTSFTPSVVRVIAYGGGGGGGGGSSNTGAVVRSGGCGGGGGARAERTYLAADLASTESYSIGAGGTAGTAGASGGDGGVGGAGGNTTFSSGLNLVTAYGGGGGGTITANTNGAAGGAGGACGGGGGGGGVGSNTGTGGAGGAGGVGRVYVVSW